MENKISLEDILDKQCDKIHQLDIATTFVKCNYSLKFELSLMRDELSEAKCEIRKMEDHLKKLKQQNKECQELLLLFKSLDKKIKHINENVPEELIQAYKNVKEESDAHANNVDVNFSNNAKINKNLYQNASNINSVHVKGRQESVVKDCKKTLFNDPEICPLISLMDKEEFANIPKYIIGRQSLESLNSFINILNEMVRAKYAIIHAGKEGARRKNQLKLYQHFKSQEITDESGYLYFFTGEDYKRHMSVNLDKTKLNLITALRHCKRLREHRSGNELRYVILSS